MYKFLRSISLIFFVSFSTLLARSIIHKSHHISVKDSLSTSLPLLADTKYFSYKSYNARDVTVKSLHEFNGPNILHKYYNNPQKVFDFLCLIILVEKSLQGVSVELMTPQEREEMALAQITIYLRKYGFIKILKKYEKTEDPASIISGETICLMVQDIKQNIFNEVDHYQPIFDSKTNSV